jgi:hypothetical protein
MGMRIQRRGARKPGDRPGCPRGAKAAPWDTQVSPQVYAETAETVVARRKQSPSFARMHKAEPYATLSRQGAVQ